MFTMRLSGGVVFCNLHWSTRRWNWNLGGTDCHSTALLLKAQVRLGIFGPIG